MGSVVIATKTYQIYGTLQAAKDYWNSDLVSAAAIKWNAAADDVKSSTLVQATHLLDRQQWQGLPVGVPVVDVVLQWPRVGVVDAHGLPVDSGSVPDGVVRACYELACAGLTDPGVFSAATSGKNIKRVKSGSTEVEFWQSTLGITGRFATSVSELIGQYLAGAVGGSVSGSASYGTDGTTTSQTANDYDLNRGL